MHTCTFSGQGKQKRYTLLKGLAEDVSRHMVLLTATPHSGDEEAFYNLLGLLHPEFRELKGRNITLYVRALRAFESPEARAAARELDRAAGEGEGEAAGR